MSINQYLMGLLNLNTNFLPNKTLRINTIK
uniref:Uncharacterized protein n=1 Tax=Populus trichocarpa TaxID=3694 RepID=A0A3N7EVP6_POPTR